MNLKGHDALSVWLCMDKIGTVHKGLGFKVDYALSEMMKFSLIFTLNFMDLFVSLPFI